MAGPAAPPPDPPSRAPGAAPAAGARAVPPPEGEGLDPWFAAATEGGRRLAWALARPGAWRGEAGWLGLPGSPDGGMRTFDEDQTDYLGMLAEAVSALGRMRERFECVASDKD